VSIEEIKRSIGISINIVRMKKWKHDEFTNYG